MNEESMAWFHCGRCAALFQSATGELGERRCTECGEDPSLGLAVAPAAAASVWGVGRDPLLKVKMAEVQKPEFRKREVRRRRSGHLILKMVLGWAVVMTFVVFVGKYFFWGEAPEEKKEIFAEQAVKGTLADEDVALLSRVYPKTREIMASFLSAGTPEGRNQFVRTPVETAGRMARFYLLNPIENVDPQTVRGTGGGVIRLPKGKAIETRWETTKGQEFDVVFFQEKGEWRLDWEEYAQYGDYPWALFLEGSGEAEGEFRLLALEQSPELRTDISRLKVVLIAPRFGYPGDAGGASMDFLVDQDSEQGRMIKAALKERAAGHRVFGSELPNHDPDAAVRLRVRVRRVEGPLGPEFLIGKVLAGHWLSLDEPGLTPAKPGF